MSDAVKRKGSLRASPSAPQVQDAETRAALKPCPFCGGEAGDLHFTETDEWEVWCLRPGSICGARGGAQATQAEAIAAWNTRASNAYSDMKEAK